MTIIGKCALLAAVLCLSACSATTKQLSNPPALHDPGAMPNAFDANDPEHLAIKAGRLLLFRYYKAMEAAQSPTATPAQIQAYVKEGIGVVETNCVRWFRLVAEAQRRTELLDTNRNVISALGTALIGVARLHSDVTTVYGAANTALGGFNANINTAYLVAPNAETVKRLTMKGLRERGDLLLDSSSGIYPTDFPSAYAELEKLGDICTYSEVRRLATESVEKSRVDADPNTGELTVVSVAVVPVAVVLPPDVRTNKRGLTCAIGKLTAADLPKASAALTALDSKAKVADVAAAKDQLQAVVRQAREPARVAELDKIFRTAGLDPTCP